MNYVNQDSVNWGYAPEGTLVVDNNDQLFRIVKARKVKYLVVDEDGKEWTGPFRHFRLAPEGTVFSGPEVAPSVRRQAVREAAAAEFSLGDTVVFKRNGPATAGKKFLVTRRTSPGRFKLQEIGGPGIWTCHATMIEKA